jgi:hypothetical protein
MFKQEDFTMRVEVYRNLLKQYRNLDYPVWSVKSRDRNYHTGIVIAHVREISLVNAFFKVSEAGRQRVLREQKKNVHATIIGDLQGFTGLVKNRVYVGAFMNKECSTSLGTDGLLHKAMYNPYKYETFVHAVTGDKLTVADKVVLNGDGVRYAYRLTPQEVRERAKRIVDSWPQWKRDVKLTKYS